jgi:Domain of unknown function (DUF4365)
VWELKFGSWVLLQPERLNAYAQAVLQSMRQDEHERGCLLESRVLGGDLTYQASMRRLEGEEERFVLLAMYQTLVERGLCLREHTEDGPLLVFPSFYRRERQHRLGYPGALVSYYFKGFLDDIYATLVVRLHHTQSFIQDQLWRYAADFKTLSGKRLGIKLSIHDDGIGELKVYFDRDVSRDEKIVFSKYVHEHLLEHASDVRRLRHYVCLNCGVSAGNPEVAMKKQAQGIDTMLCVNCEQRIPLRDELEQMFVSSQSKQLVRKLQQRSAMVLDGESEERALVGEVISTVTLAGQLCREYNQSDQGIDMEIEFVNDENKATGQKLYLQLKASNSYIPRKSPDESEIFEIAEPSQATRWMNEKFPVMLVKRNADGTVWWMDVRQWFRRTSESAAAVSEIVFQGEQLDVMSVRNKRNKALSWFL